MSIVWRRLKRVNKRAAKFKFVVLCKELIFDCAPKWRPDQVMVSLMHRRRRYATKPKRVEWSFDNPSRAIIIWPEISLDPISLTTTLFRDQENEQYDDKEWTLIVEELAPKGKTRPLAAVPINVRLFVNDIPGTRMEAKFKLRPLRKEIKQCTIQLDLRTALISEGSVVEDDLKSLASNASVALERSISRESSVEIPPPPVDNYRPVDNFKPISSPTSPVKPKQEVNEIIKLSDEIQKWVPSIDDNDKTPVKTEPDSCQPQVPKLHEKPKVREIPLPPEKLQGEPLLDWCKRVSKGYKNVLIKDFTKSFKTGWAFCAIIYRYRPDVIDEYSTLEFSETIACYQRNVTKALEAAKVLGCRKSLDLSSVVTLPDRNQIQQFLIELRSVLEGSQSDEDYRSPTSEVSDHRLSMFALSPNEAGIVNNMEEIRSARKGNENEPPLSPVLSRKHYEEALQLQEAKDLADDVHNTKLSSTGTLDRKEEHRKKARKMLENPVTALSSNGESSNFNETDSEAHQRRQAEARMLLQGDRPMQSNGTSFTSTPLGGPLKRSRSIRSNSSFGSNTELRTLGLVEKQTTFRTFKKGQPSPALQRKQYESPILPAFGLNDNLTPVMNNALDRVKRFGSQRAQELSESLNQYLVQNNGRRLNPSYVQNEAEQTPKRKVESRADNDLKERTDCSQELQEISDRMDQIEKLQTELIRRRQAVKTGSDEETRLVTEQIQLTGEKDDLVMRQHYLNVLVEIFETDDSIEQARTEYGKLGVNGHAQNEQEHEQMNELMLRIDVLVKEKLDLTEKLQSLEEEHEESREFKRDTLERSKNFNRGTPQQPLSASKRLFNFLSR